jgi:hypothetical protein
MYQSDLNNCRMIQTDAQEQGAFFKSSYKPNNRTPGLLSCYGMIFKWAKVIQNPYIIQETPKIDISLLQL